jgi:hypothetical protein
MAGAVLQTAGTPLRTPKTAKKEGFIVPSVCVMMMLGNLKEDAD